MTWCGVNFSYSTLQIISYGNIDWYILDVSSNVHRCLKPCRHDEKQSRYAWITVTKDWSAFEIILIGGKVDIYCMVRYLTNTDMIQSVISKSRNHNSFYLVDHSSLIAWIFLSSSLYLTMSSCLLQLLSLDHSNTFFVSFLYS